jgi:hypothetical protein
MTFSDEARQAITVPCFGSPENSNANVYLSLKVNVCSGLMQSKALVILGLP